MIEEDDVRRLRASRRILVAGVSGVGKSTLARRLAGCLDLPYTELDALFHGPDWTTRPGFLADVGELAASPDWVTEWQYGPARPVLLSRAEVLVWLDLPFRITLLRVVRRTVDRRRRRTRLFAGNVEPALRTFFTDRQHIVRWAISTRRRYRTLVPAAARDDPDVHVIRLRSQRQVDVLVARLEG